MTLIDVPFVYAGEARLWVFSGTEPLAVGAAFQRERPASDDGELPSRSHSPRASAGATLGVFILGLFDSVDQTSDQLSPL